MRGGDFFIARRTLGPVDTRDGGVVGGFRLRNFFGAQTGLEFVVLRLAFIVNRHCFSEPLFEVKFLQHNQRLARRNALAFFDQHFLHPPADARPQANFVGLDHAGNFRRRVTLLAPHEHAEQNQGDHRQRNQSFGHGLQISLAKNRSTLA